MFNFFDMSKRKHHNNDDTNEYKQIKRVRRRKYYKVGKMIAKAQAAIIKIDDEDYIDLAQKFNDIRFFFRPDLSDLHALRVKPSITTIYGGEKMKVFAVPPAPEQWVEEMSKKMDKLVHVEIFVENLPEKKFAPYGYVIYDFSEIKENKLQPIPTVESNFNLNTQHLILLAPIFLSIQFIHAMTIKRFIIHSNKFFGSWNDKIIS